MDTIFIEVYRVEHDDTMFIPAEVQKKYPDKFIIKTEEVAEEVEVETTKRKRKAKE